VQLLEVVGVSVNFPLDKCRPFQRQNSSWACD